MVQRCALRWRFFTTFTLFTTLIIHSSNTRITFKTKTVYTNKYLKNIKQ